MTDLKADIRKGIRIWRFRRTLLDWFESRLEDSPGDVWVLFTIVIQAFCDQAKILSRYGVEVPELPREFEPELVAPERLPRTTAEMAEYYDAVAGATAFRVAWDAGVTAFGMLGDLEEESVLRLAGRYMLEELRKAPIWCGLEMSERQLPQALRQRGLVDLTSHVASVTSLRANRRLRTAVSDEAELNPFIGFIEKLPTVVIIEWEEAGWEARFDGFEKRVGKLLEGERSISHKLASERKLADTEPGDEGYDELDLATFTQRELRALRRRTMRRLNRIIEEARLSDPERRVFRMALALLNNEQIAERRGRSNEQIRQEKLRARNKLRARPEYTALEPVLIRIIREMRRAG